MAIWDYVSQFDNTGLIGCVGPTEVVPDSFTTFRGVNISGGLADILESNDSYLKHNPGFTLTGIEAPIWLVFDAALPSDSPGSLSVELESSANTPGLTQTTEVYDWNSGAFVELGSEAASFNSDVVQSVDITPGISDFVESGSGNVRTRVGWRMTGFTLVFPWTVCVDHVAWVAE